MSDLAEVERATRALIAACAADDPDAIRAAIDRRGAALRGLLDRRGTADEAARARIATLAAEAEEALRGVQRRVRDEFRRLRDGAQAVRGYAEGDTRVAAERRTASALDRAG